MEKFDWKFYIFPFQNETLAWEKECKSIILYFMYNSVIRSIQIHIQINLAKQSTYNYC